MKKSLCLTLIFCAVTLLAQEKADRFTSGSNNQPRDPRMDQMSYVPNEILVKFKDETSISAASKIKAAGISGVDQVLQKYEITSLERLFPGEKKPTRAKIMRSPQGTELKVPALDKIYRVTVPNTETPLAQPVNIHQIIEELKALPEIEYAEPNYIYSIDQLQPIGPEISADDLARMQNSRQKNSSTAVVPNDPLYPQQWYIPAVKADLVWEQTTGDTTQVIAILDTGVDWTHPDLKNKIWRNWGEIPDNGIDDDGNGLVDDYMGWDYINNDNNPMDDNSHGTHVAGIAAAEANNGIGIAGVNWHAKIMPVKVFPPSGRGDMATITRGIFYAATSGATVINMSFGSYGGSQTLEHTLSNAVADNILCVASAGNDSYSIYDKTKSFPPLSATHFPAVFPFVFGVQSNGSYSNFDPDGPVFSLYNEQGYNYELKAPGTALSTVPKGNYRQMSGTSMASPVVAGALALYRSFYPDKSIEELWSDFIYSSTEIINLEKIFNPTEKKVWLDLQKFEVKETEVGSDLDGKADAGETVEIIVQVRNTGVPANNVYLRVAQSNDGDPRDVTIEKDSVYLGSIGIFRSLKNDIEPFLVKINPDCYNNRRVSLDVQLYSAGELLNTQQLHFMIFNGEELTGILLRDTVLTPDKNWSIHNSLRISTGVTVTILPGTSVEVSAGVDNRGTVIALGTPENRITMKGFIGGNAKYNYADIDLNNGSLNATLVDNCNITNLSVIDASTTVSNSYLSNILVGIKSQSLYRCYVENAIMIQSPNSTNFTENVFDEITLGDWYFTSLNSNYTLQSNVFKSIHNYNFKYNPYYYEKYKNKGYLIKYEGTYEIEGYWSNDEWIEAKIFPNIKNNTFLNNGTGVWFVKTSGGNDMVTLPNQYWGTEKVDKIKSKFEDFMVDAGTPYLSIEPKLIAPSDSCPGHVWKVLVNSKDAQDEVVDPVGIGKHRFDVYFNRPMKKDLIPQVSFGGKYPYTSIPINEDGSWSEDRKIYTVYKTIKLTTGDGINRIRVAGAKQDADWGWEIPVEDQRFNFIIAAASSASTDFMATPGLGKVALEWNHNDLEDGLGYNMYRMEHINDSTLTQPVIINSSLITDTLYTDYSVVPNKKYYYYYKILRTNMAETDSSRVVSAIPFTASKGDANGDLNVNVLDITTIVAHLLNNNPQPFILEAADVNSDNQINVLDIVGVVNMVLNIPQNAPGIAMNKQVDLYLQNDTLFANSNVDIGAIQLDIAGIDKFEDIEVLNVLKAFESGNSYANGSLRVIFYSMSGKSIALGQAIPLLKLKSGSMINDAIIGEPNGSSVKVNYIKTRIPDISANMNQNIAELGQNYPNPVNGFTTIPVRIYEPVDEILLRVVNMMGQEVEVIRLSNPVTGENLINWNPKQHKGLLMYKLEIRQGGNRSVCPAKRMMVK